MPSPLKLLACAALLGVLGASAQPDYDDLLKKAQADPAKAFAEFAALHGKSYALGPGAANSLEYSRRFEVFQANLAKIQAHNARKDTSYWLGLNQHADLTADEFRTLYLGEQPGNLVEQRAAAEAAAAEEGEEEGAGAEEGALQGWRRRERHKMKRIAKKIKPLPFPYSQETAPPSANWAAKGLITPVKDQHLNGSPCGCCYAFGGMAAIEAANALYTGTPLSLSEQEIVDCDALDHGCGGGDFTNVFKWTILNGGVDTMEDYPYVANVTACKWDKAKSHKAVSIDAFVNVPRANESALQQAVAHTPVGTGVCCGQFIDQWHLYKGGIFDESVHCNEPIDHAVLIVGYDTDKETGADYWLVKNSWGAHWGEGGYIRFARNTPYSRRGQSGLATFPAYAVKSSPNPKPTAEASRATLRRGDAQPATGTAATASSGLLGELIGRCQRWMAAWVQSPEEQAGAVV